MMPEEELFTPLDENYVRLNFKKKDVEFLPGYEHRRGLGLRGRVRIKGVVYNVYGRACAAPNCQCDAMIKRVKQ